MKYGGLIIETKEYGKMIQLAGETQQKKDDAYQLSIAKLLGELKEAKKLPVAKMPDDVVRFNSVVEIALPDGKLRTIQVVSSDKSDFALNRISILAPMGMALFGYAAGDEVQWHFPSGIKAIKILKVKQSIHEPKKR